MPLEFDEYHIFGDMNADARGCSGEPWFEHDLNLGNAFSTSPEWKCNFAVTTFAYDA
jgi:hypothetical protein